MDIVLEQSLRCKIQKKIILFLYQNEQNVCASDLAKIVQSSKSSISNITNDMRSKGILNYYTKGKYRYFTLTKEAMDYLFIYHPEIKPAKCRTNTTDSNEEEFLATSKEKQLAESLIEEIVHPVNDILDINPELRKSYINAIELLKFPKYMKLLINYSLKEAILISLLIVCYLENKNYNYNEIAMLFGISESEVQNVYRKTLLMLKDSMNKMIDNVLYRTSETPQSENGITK